MGLVVDFWGLVVTLFNIVLSLADEQSSPLRDCGRRINWGVLIKYYVGADGNPPTQVWICYEKGSLHNATPTTGGHRIRQTNLMKERQLTPPHECTEKAAPKNHPISTAPTSISVPTLRISAPSTPSFSSSLQ